METSVFKDEMSTSTEVSSISSFDRSVSFVLNQSNFHGCIVCFTYIKSFTFDSVSEENKYQMRQDLHDFYAN